MCKLASLSKFISNKDFIIFVARKFMHMLLRPTKPIVPFISVANPTGLRYEGQPSQLYHSLSSYLFKANQADVMVCLEFIFHFPQLTKNVSVNNNPNMCEHAKI